MALVSRFDWIESNKGNPIRSSVLKYVRLYREFERADLIGFPLLDSIQSNHVLQEPLILRAPGPAGLRGPVTLGREWQPLTVHGSFQ